MRYRELLSVRGTFLLLFVGLVLVNLSALSDNVLRSTRRRGLLLFFCLGEDFGCKNVLSKIALLDKIFKVLTEGSTLRRLVSFAVMEGAVVLRSGTSRIVWLCFRTLHSGLTFDGFKDIMDRELQRSEAVIHAVGSKWALLRVREWSLLKTPCPRPWLSRGLRDAASVLFHCRHG